MYVHSFDCGQNQRQRESSRITKAFLFCSFHLFPICTCRPDQLFLAKMRRLTAFIYLTTVSKRTSENLFHFSFRFIFFPFSKSLFGWKVERKRKRQLKHSLFPSPSAFLPLFNDSRNVVGWIRSSWRHLSTCDPTECLFDFSSLLVFCCPLLFRLFSLFICLFGVRVFFYHFRPLFLERPSADLTFRNTYQRPVSFVFQLPGTAFSLSCHVDSRMAGERVAVVFCFFLFLYILNSPIERRFPVVPYNQVTQKEWERGGSTARSDTSWKFLLSLFLHQEFKGGKIIILI